ncbi:MAG: TetR/AcrR family transcriptional regulator [Polyangiales bacterium]
MGRPSKRAERRKEILEAFARVLANHGYAGATIAAIAEEASVAPGLIHHHFKGKDELLTCLLDQLVADFRARTRAEDAEDGEALHAYANAALRLRGASGVAGARCWVGLFAEAVRDPALFRKVRRVLDAEVSLIQERSGGTLSAQQSSGVMAFIVGALVFGAFAPTKTRGFAAPCLHEILGAFAAT